MRDRTSWLVQISCLLLTCSTKSCTPTSTIKRTQQESNPDRLEIKYPPTTNRWNMTWRTSSHLTPNYTKMKYTPAGLGGPPLLVYGYYSVHPWKGRVVLSQLPLVMWAPGCWHYEWTFSSHQPLPKRDQSFYLSIYLYGRQIMCQINLNLSWLVCSIFVIFVPFKNKCRACLQWLSPHCLMATRHLSK